MNQELTSSLRVLCRTEYLKAFRSVNLEKTIHYITAGQEEKNILTLSNFKDSLKLRTAHPYSISILSTS